MHPEGEPKLTRRDLLKAGAGAAIAGVFGRSSDAKAEAPRTIAEVNALPEAFAFEQDGIRFRSNFLGSTISTEIGETWKPNGIITPEGVRKIEFADTQSPTKVQLWSIELSENEDIEDFAVGVTSAIEAAGGKTTGEPLRKNYGTEGQFQAIHIFANIPTGDPENPMKEFEGAYFPHNGQLWNATLECPLDWSVFGTATETYWNALAKLDIKD